MAAGGVRSEPSSSQSRTARSNSWSLMPVVLSLELACARPASKAARSARVA